MSQFSEVYDLGTHPEYSAVKGIKRQDPKQCSVPDGNPWVDLRTQQGTRVASTRMKDTQVAYIPKIFLLLNKIHSHHDDIQTRRLHS